MYISLGKRVKSLAQFKLLVFALLTCEGSLCVLDVSTYQMQDFHGYTSLVSTFFTFFTRALKAVVLSLWVSTPLGVE